DLAGDVDDARGLGAAQQRQQRVGDRDRAEDVGLVDGAHGVDRGGRRQQADVEAAGDGGVVDQDVEPAEFGLDVGGGLGDRGGVGDVQPDEPDVTALGGQLLGGGAPALGIPGTDQDGAAPGGQGTSGFVAETLVGPGDQSDGVGGG